MNVPIIAPRPAIAISAAMTVHQNPRSECPAAQPRLALLYAAAAIPSQATPTPIPKARSSALVYLNLGSRRAAPAPAPLASHCACRITSNPNKRVSTRTIGGAT